MTDASRSRALPRLGRLLALATDNWPARGYLAVVAASVAVMFLFPESGFAADPLTLTAPLSFLGVVLPFGPGTESGGAVGVAVVGFWAGWLLLCAFVNAAVLGALVARSATAAPSGSPAPLPRASLPRVPAPAERPRLRRTRALLAPAVDNWLARGYLAVVAAALGFFLCAAYVLADPGFAGIWPLMATAPVGLFAFLLSTPAEYSSLTWLSPLIFAAGTALAGLFNAVLLGRLAHRLRVREPRPAV
ncbi:SCO4225 family membrane protein [Streptomyces sp. NPDC002740]